MFSQTEERISLFYKDERSDKEYHAQLAAAAGGFVVNFQYGRRGSSLQSGTKTDSPVGYDKAKKVFDKLAAEKKAKGYVEGETAVGYQQAVTPGVDNGLRPQLLNPINTTAAVSLLRDDGWFLQEKKDGRRTLVRNTGRTVEAVNRKGAFIALSKTVEQALQRIGGYFVFDGESIGEVYWVFDLLEFDRIDFRGCPFAKRYGKLCELFQDSPVDGPVRLVPTATTYEAKVALIEQLRRARAEGVVFKRANAQYISGRPNSCGDQLKYKFTADATCRVIGQNLGKRSIRLAMRGADGSEVEVGNVTIPPNHEIPADGALAHVEYLYAFDGGSLYQPVYRGVRDDIDEVDLLASLKLKREDEDET